MGVSRLIQTDGREQQMPQFVFIVGMKMNTSLETQGIDEIYGEGSLDWGQFIIHNA
jgi:hypothetical protein